jgi:replicative DNA helicase
MRAEIRAEQALLGAVLADPEGHDDVLRLVSPEDFLRPWHGQVLAAMRQVRARAVAPGPLAVYAELKKNPDLPQAVARDAVPLADLMHASPCSSHASTYAGMVIGAAVRRGLVGAAGDDRGGAGRQAGEGESGWRPGRRTWSGPART